MAREVILLDFWPSFYGMRARIALSEKGVVDYDYQEQDIRNKSEILLEMNPVHKKIPVLIHNGRPICESLVIVQYIDEVWADKAPLIPSDPYERAQARFWADYVDKKEMSAAVIEGNDQVTSHIISTTIGGKNGEPKTVFEGLKKIWKMKGEEQEKAKAEFIEIMKVLEEQALGDKPFFGGDEFGFVDVALIPLYCWFHTFEVKGNFKVEDSCPKIIDWVNRCLLRDSVAKSLQDPNKVYSFVLSLE